MKRIALIEDDPTVREELALLLENEGYQVLGVTDFTAVPRQVQAFGADLVLLDRDPLSCPPEELKDIRVVETIKDGETVYKNE